MIVLLPLSACSGGSSGSNKSDDSPAAKATPIVVKDSLVNGVTNTHSAFTTPRNIDVKVPQIAPARNLSQAIEVVRERSLRQAQWDSATKVTQTSSFVASSAQILGVKISTTIEGPKPHTFDTTLWYDANYGQTFSPSVLISWPGWAKFRNSVGEAADDASVDKAKALAALQESPAPYGTGPAMSFGSEGELLVAFPAGVLDKEQKTLLVPKDKVDPVLSDLGVKAQGASLHPSTFSGTPDARKTWWKPANDRPAPQSSPNLHPLPGDSTAGKDASADSQARPSKQPTAPSTTSTAISAAPVKDGEHPSTAVGIDCIARQCVALTYDDGPGKRTGELLKTFEKQKAAATFFEMGNSIDAAPDTTRLVAASGFEIGNHSSTHPDLATLSTQTLKTEVGGNSDRLAKLTGRRPMLLRPPYGDHNDTADKVITDNNMAVINWSIDTNDWQTHSAPKTLDKISKDVSIYTGPITLMHDIHDAAIDASATAVPNLTRRGYQLVTVSELTLNTGGVQAGHGYCRGNALVQDGYLCKG